MMHTFVINLEECTDRRAAALAQCARFGLEPEVVPAVRGAALSAGELEACATPEARNWLTPGEIGCALSHLRVADEIVRRNLPYALVLEDDIVWARDPAPFLAAAKEVAPRFPASVFLMTHLKKYIASAPVRTATETLYPAYDAFTTCAYVMTKDAAKALRTFALPLRMEIDIWRAYVRNRVFRVWVSEADYTDVAALSASPSTLGDGHAAGAENLARKQYRDREARRIFSLPNRALYLAWKTLRKPFARCVQTY